MNESELLELAMEFECYDKKTFLSRLAHPVWSGEHAEWGFFVPLTFRDKWNELTLDMKLVIFITASNAFNYISK